MYEDVYLQRYSYVGKQVWLTLRQSVEPIRQSLGNNTCRHVHGYLIWVQQLPSDGASPRLHWAATCGPPVALMCRNTFLVSSHCCCYCCCCCCCCSCCCGGGFLATWIRLHRAVMKCGGNWAQCQCPTGAVVRLNVAAAATTNCATASDVEKREVSNGHVGDMWVADKIIIASHLLWWREWEEKWQTGDWAMVIAWE